MKKKARYKLHLCSLCAGIVNGLFGAGGGMVLVPLLSRFAKVQEDQVFPASVAMILPISIVSLFLSAMPSENPWQIAIPCLIGSAAGGIAAGFLGKKIPTVWLHRFLGGLILWGGVRYLC